MQLIYLLIFLPYLFSTQMAQFTLIHNVIAYIVYWIAPLPRTCCHHMQQKYTPSTVTLVTSANAWSRASKHHYLYINQSFPPNNSAILTVSKIMKAGMSSTDTAGLEALYLNACKGVKIQNRMVEMGHAHPTSPIQTDNSTADSIINVHIQPKYTKAMDMQFFWLQNCSINKKQFCFFWRLGTTNLADYWTKYYLTSHHCHICSEFLTPFHNVLTSPMTNTCMHLS